MTALALSPAPALAQAPPGAPSMRGDGPGPEAAPFSVTRLDPRIDAIVPADAQAELLAENFGINEGPVWVPEADGDGFLLIGGLIDNVLYKIAADRTVSVFLEQAGYSGNDPNHVGTQTRAGRSHVLLIGPSCAGLDSEGRVIWCANNDRAVMRLERDGARTVLATGRDGLRFSGPNDIAIRRDDGVYLTDNDFGLRGAGASPDKELENGVWLLRDGQARLVLSAESLGGIPNGVALSPDERWLYLSAGLSAQLWRYEVLADGGLGERSLFSEGPGIGDGMKVDEAGNLYSTGGSGPGRVRIMAPDGTLLGFINLPVLDVEPKRQICATNVAFGDADRRSLFITACDNVYRVRLSVTGITSGPAPAAWE
jgi:gluconolactonase